MTTSLDLLALVYAAILGPNAKANPPVYATDAGAKVFKPGDWPTQIGQYPIIKIRLGSEDRQSITRSGPPQFITTATVLISLEVSAPAAINDVGATNAETALWNLKRQVEIAVVNSYPLTDLIQQIPAMRSQLSFSSEAATHLAGMDIQLSLEFYEDATNFAPIEAAALTDVEITGAHPVSALSLTLPQ